jgi:hypothetical protein
MERENIAVEHVIEVVSINGRHNNLLCRFVLIAESYRPGWMRGKGSRERLTLPHDAYPFHCVLLLSLLTPQDQALDSTLGEESVPSIHRRPIR